MHRRPQTFEKRILDRLRNSRFHPVFDLLVKTASRFGPLRCDATQAAVLAGSPRSGTTWVSEVLCMAPEMEMIVEPFDSNRNPQIEQRGFTLNTYLPPDASHENKRAYVSDLFAGRNLTGRHVHAQAQISSLLQARRFLIKCVRGNRLLPWIEQNFDVHSILLLRHPCAVVASQLKFQGGWDNDLRRRFEAGAIHDRLRQGLHEGTYPYLPVDLLRTLDERVGGLVGRLQTFEHFLAFKWVGDTLIPLRHPSRRRYILTYEQFVQDGENQLRKLFSHIGETAVPDDAFDRLHVPSATTQPHSNVAKGKDPLTTWRRHLTSDQIDDILHFVHDAGIDFYDDELTPHADELGPVASHQLLSKE